MGEHPSSSKVQQEVEAHILARLGAQLDIELQQGVRIELGDASVKVDGATQDESVIVEVFARVGKAKGGQLHKVSTDTLKLVALKKSRPRARLILAFASEEAEESVVGWRQEALRMWGIEAVVVDIGEDLTARIIAAQTTQKMVNAPPDEPSD